MFVDDAAVPVAFKFTAPTDVKAFVVVAPEVKDPVIIPFPRAVRLFGRETFQLESTVAKGDGTPELFITINVLFGDVGYVKLAHEGVPVTAEILFAARANKATTESFLVVIFFLISLKFIN